MFGIGYKPIFVAVVGNELDEPQLVLHADFLELDTLVERTPRSPSTRKVLSLEAQLLVAADITALVWAKIWAALAQEHLGFSSDFFKLGRIRPNVTNFVDMPHRTGLLAQARKNGRSRRDANSSYNNTCMQSRRDIFAMPVHIGDQNSGYFHHPFYSS